MRQSGTCVCMWGGGGGEGDGSCVDSYTDHRLCFQQQGFIQKYF